MMLRADSVGFMVSPLLRDRCWALLSPGVDADLVRTLAGVGLRPEAKDEDLAKIPVAGPVLALANGACDLIDALAAAELLSRTRADVKVLANCPAASMHLLSPALIGSDGLRKLCSPRGNLHAFRVGLAHLRSGGLLVVFPDPGRPHKMEGEQRGWTVAARAARLLGANIVPVSLARLEARTSAFANLSGAAVEMGVGALLASRRLSEFSSHAEAGAYVQWRSTLLVRRREPPVRLVPRLFSIPTSAA